jgi:hypothetical protein
MFRSTNIIRELVLNLAKVIFVLKHSVKLRRYMLFGDVTARHRAACVLCAMHTTHTPLCDVLPHHQIAYNDVILPSVLTQI